MSNLLNKIDEAYKNNRDKTVIVTQNQTLSYIELKQRVDNVAGALYQIGVKPHDLIASILPNDIDFVILMLAAAKLNATLVPLSFGITNTAFTQAQRTLTFKHVICWHALYSDKSKHSPKSRITNWISVGKDVVGIERLERWYNESSNKTIPNNELNGDDPFILTMTSGSTGMPKPIELSQNTKLLRANTAIELYELNDKDITLIATPLYHSLAQRLMFVSLLTGGTLVIMNKFNIQGWLDTVVDHKVTFTIAVSSQLKQLNSYLTHNSPNLTSLRCLVSSSALLDHETKVELLDKLQCDFHECYGTSEIAIATNIQFNALNKNTSVGHPINNTDIVLLDDERNEVGINQIGEIACKTNMRFSGYYQKPQLTADSFYGDYFCTGDLGKFDSNKQLYYLGRKKEIIITGGINVYPSDIEDVVKSVPKVKDCISFAINDDNLGEAVALAVIPESSDELSTLVNNIRIHCATELDHHQQPRAFFFFSSYPQNEMNKINKLEIKDIAELHVLKAKQNQKKQVSINSTFYFTCN